MGGKARRSKSRREMEKRFRKLKKMESGKGKPAGVRRQLTKEERAAAMARKAAKSATEKKLVRLKRIGEGWFPKITQEAYNKLKKHQKVEVFSYVYDMDHARSEGHLVYFKVATGLGARIGQERYVGTFLIDFEENSIRQVRGKLE